jgi:bifunctional DNase/RNase
MTGPRLVTWLAIAAAAATLPACTPRDAVSEHEIAMHVQRVGLDAQNLPVVLLEESGGSRWIAIWIGSAEAESIAMSIDHVAGPRPNTHDLASSVIDGLRGEVERVVVTDLRAGTYYATLALRAGSRRVEIDARPSDAIAIALRLRAPIFVRDHLLARDAGGGGDPSATPSI